MMNRMRINKYFTAEEEEEEEQGKSNVFDLDIFARLLLNLL